MKILHIIFWFCLSLSFLQIANAEPKDYAENAKQEIIFSGDYWCPYNCEPNSEYEGYMVDILKAIFDAEGYSVKYQLSNWSRALKETRSGRFHGVIGALKGDAPDFLYHKTALGQSSTSIWAHKKTNITYKQLSDLDPFTIGISQDYSYGKTTDTYLAQQPKNKVSALSGLEPLNRNIQRLKNRIDVLLEDESVMLHHLKQSTNALPIKLAGIICSEDVFVALSPVNPNAKRYAKIIDEGIEKLRTSGALASILARYGLTDWH